MPFIFLYEHGFYFIFNWRIIALQCCVGFCYTPQQVFNLNMSSRTFIATEEKSKPGFEASEEKLTLILGAYAASDFNLKPMLFTILKILGP